MIKATDLELNPESLYYQQGIRDEKNRSNNKTIQAG